MNQFERFYTETEGIVTVLNAGILFTATFSLFCSEPLEMLQCMVRKLEIPKFHDGCEDDKEDMVIITPKVQLLLAILVPCLYFIHRGWRTRATKRQYMEALRKEGNTLEEKELSLIEMNMKDRLVAEILASMAVIPDGNET